MRVRDDRPLTETENRVMDQLHHGGRMPTFLHQSRTTYRVRSMLSVEEGHIYHGLDKLRQEFLQRMFEND